MRRRFVITCAVILCVLFSFGFSGYAAASTATVTPTDKPIGIAINGEDIDCSSAPPQIINGKVMIPIETIEKFCGARVGYCSTFNMVFVDYPIDYSAFDDTNNTVTLEQEKDIARNFITRFEKAVVDAANVGGKSNADVEEFYTALKNLSELRNELKLWGTTNEYKPLRGKLLNVTEHLYSALYYKKESESSSSPTSVVYANTFASHSASAYDGVLEVQTEIKSLSKQGLL